MSRKVEAPINIGYSMCFGRVNFSFHSRSSRGTHQAINEYPHPAALRRVTTSAWASSSPRARTPSARLQWRPVYLSGVVFSFCASLYAGRQPGHRTNGPAPRVSSGRRLAIVTSASTLRQNRREGYESPYPRHGRANHQCFSRLWCARKPEWVGDTRPLRRLGGHRGRQSCP